MFEQDTHIQNNKYNNTNKTHKRKDS